MLAISCDGETAIWLGLLGTYSGPLCPQPAITNMDAITVINKQMRFIGSTLVITIDSDRWIIDAEAMKGASFYEAFGNLFIGITERDTFFAYQPIGLCGREYRLVEINVIRDELQPIQQVRHNVDAVDGQID
jgi:hypothetical protein